MQTSRSPFQDHVLRFLTTNPIAWRSSTLARRLEVDARRLRRALERLSVTGKIVSCRVTTGHDRLSELECRVSASVPRAPARRS